MASTVQNILRSIVAGPRARHPEANLDLCYVTDKIIATSGPSASYPSLAYRNPLDQLVQFLDSRHGENWHIWEFRAEGCGYPDSEVYNRIWHFPWPDHHPPPFALVPKIMATMRNWLHPLPDSSSNSKADPSSRVIVVHCKAGKGRSGTMAISYLITHEGWQKQDALQRFTERRMRPNFGAGISIPSQLRWINYVERWAGPGGRIYVERAVEVTEVHVWGLRDGVKLSIEGFIDSGKKIKTFHVFGTAERDDDPGPEQNISPLSQKSFTGRVHSVLSSGQLSSIKSIPKQSSSRSSLSTSQTSPAETGQSESPQTTGSQSPSAPSGSDGKIDTIFRPSTPILVPTSDINLAAIRRNNWNAVTSVAHVWFNCFFEGKGPENYAAASKKTTPPQIKSSESPSSSSPENRDETARPDPASKAAEQDFQNPSSSGPDKEGAPWAESSGVFEIAWDAMDGIKGSSRKGYKAFERVAVVWRAAVVDDAPPPIKKSGSGQNAGDDSALKPDASAEIQSLGSLPTLNIEEPNRTTSSSANTSLDTAAGKQRHRAGTGNSLIIPEPQPGEEISPVEPADWKGGVPVGDADAIDVDNSNGEEAHAPEEGHEGSEENARDRKPKRDKVPVVKGPDDGDAAAGDGHGSDSEDGAEGIRRGVLTD